MARARTLLQLRADVRVRADAANSTVDLDGVYDEWINQSAARLYNKLVAARGHAYYQSTYTFTTTAGTTLYALPPDFFELQLAQISVGSAKQAMRPFMLKEASRWSESAPVAGYTVTLRYTPAPQRMVAPGDTFDGIAGWEEWIVLDAAIKALAKEESDVSVLMAQRADIEREIVGMAPNREAQWPDRVIDVERLGGSLTSVPMYRLAQDQIEILWGPTYSQDFW